MLVNVKIIKNYNGYRKGIQTCIEKMEAEEAERNGYLEIIHDHYETLHSFFSRTLRHGRILKGKNL